MAYVSFGINSDESATEESADDTVIFTAPKDGYLYVNTEIHGNDYGAFRIAYDYIADNLVPILNISVNPWKGKKIAFVGSSYTYGQYSAKSYNTVAAEILGFNLVNMGVPGNCVHLYNDNTIMEFGSLCATRAEYDYKNEGFGYVNLPESGIPKIKPLEASADADLYPVVDGSTGLLKMSRSDYYRCWENVFTNDNDDIDLWVFALNGNASNFSTTDWDLFNKNTWKYNDDSTFADHRTTFLGAVLYLIDRIYSKYPNAKICFCIDGPGSLFNTRSALQILKDNMGIPYIDLFGVINFSYPNRANVYYDVMHNNTHPNTKTHESMGKILASELLKIA